MNLYLVKIRIEYQCNERWIQNRFWQTNEEMAVRNCILNLLETFKDDDAAWVDQESCIVQKIGQEK